MSIIVIDMHIRDERVLAWLRANASGRTIQVSSVQLAAVFRCHPNTAWAILHRLQSAGHITIISRGKRGGYTYEVA